MLVLGVGRLMNAHQTRLAVFGGIDGLVMFLGLALGLIIARQGGTAVWHAALGGAGGELVGMTSGQRLSDPDSGWPVAIACGVAGALACVVPAVPYLVTTGTAALTAALVIALAVGGAVAWMRPEHGWRAVVRTYLVLIGAGVLSGITGLV